MDSSEGVWDPVGGERVVSIHTGGAPLNLSDVVLICIGFVKLKFEGRDTYRVPCMGELYILCRLSSPDLDYLTKVCLFMSVLAGGMRA